MAVQESAAQARSSVVSDKIRPPWKAFLVKIGGLLGPWLSAGSAVSPADPFEAYMRVCMVAPFFCYISPAIYEAAAASKEPDVTEDDGHPGDDA